MRVCTVLLIGAAVCTPSVTHAAKPTGGPTPVAVSEFRTIEFGTVAGSADGPSTFALNTAGALTATGYGIVIKGTARAGEYKITGPDNATVLITLPTTATLSNGTSNATLSNFTSSPSAVGTLDNRGKLTLTVGATLTVPAGQSAGDYTGPITIFVDLQ